MCEPSLTILPFPAAQQLFPVELRLFPKVGDVVIYGKYAGTEVSVEGKDYLIMKQSDILAIL